MAVVRRCHTGVVAPTATRNDKLNAVVVTVRRIHDSRDADVDIACKKMKLMMEK